MSVSVGSCFACGCPFPSLSPSTLLSLSLSCPLLRHRQVFDKLDPKSDGADRDWVSIYEGVWVFW